MAKENLPVTFAVRALRHHAVEFTEHLYPYQERGGTGQSAASLGVDEHIVIKTLVMETEHGEPLVVLMHGDCEVSTQALARHLGTKRVVPCAPDKAQKLTGYTVGGTSPFGTRTPLRVFAERTIFDLPHIFINGGKRGFLVRLAPDAIKKILKVEDVEVGVAKDVGK